MGTAISVSRSVGGEKGTNQEQGGAGPQTRKRIEVTRSVDGRCITTGVAKRQRKKDLQNLGVGGGCWGGRWQHSCLGRRHGQSRRRKTKKKNSKKGTQRRSAREKGLYGERTVINSVQPQRGGVGAREEKLGSSVEDRRRWAGQRNRARERLHPRENSAKGTQRGGVKEGKSVTQVETGRKFQI